MTASLELVCAQSKQWDSALSGVSGGMKSLGLDEMSALLAVGSGALKLVAGSAEIFKAVQGTIVARNARLSAENTALVSANTLAGPVGWSKIALAGVAMLTATAVCATIMAWHYSNVQADMSTESGRSGAVQTVSAVQEV